MSDNITVVGLAEIQMDFSEQVTKSHSVKNMRPISLRDLRVGGCYYVPSGFGGVKSVECKTLTKLAAIFETIRGEHLEFECDLSEPALTDEEMIKLGEAIGGKRGALTSVNAS